MGRANPGPSEAGRKIGSSMLENQRAAEGVQEEALRRIAAGEREALGEFYDQAAGLLFSFAVRMLRDAQEAEEVIQDVFVQIWRKAETFDAKLGQPLHWALGITRNRCIDRIRARQRQSQLLKEAQEVMGTGESSPPGPDGMPALQGADELATVRGALESLPAEQREPIQWAFFGGLTHE